MFEAALHEGVERAAEGLRQALQEGVPDQEVRHSARLLDLMDRAHRNGIDTTGWVSPDLMTIAWTRAGDDL